MSRSSVMKSRPEKSASKQAQATATPVAHDIVPGKFTDHDWTVMLDHDDSDDFVADILEDWYSSVEKVIYDNYIQKQLVPYMVNQARDAILQIIEWQFLSRDEGYLADVEIEGWTPDSEPDVAVTDCWAQGAIPKVVSGNRLPFRPSLAGIADADTTTSSYTNTPGLTSRPASHCANADADLEVANRVDEAVDDERDTSASSRQPILDEEPDAKEESADKKEEKSTAHMRKQRKHRPAVKEIPSSNVDEVMDATEQTNSVEAVNIVPPTVARDWTMKKISPRHLPTNMVQTVYCVVDSDLMEAEERRRAMRDGRKTQMISANKTRSDVRITPSSFAETNRTAPSGRIAEIPATLNPMLVETMDLAAGVVVRDNNNRVKKGPKQRSITQTELLCAALRHGLQPVQRQHAMQPLSATDFVDSQVPVIRPLTETVPIPPIR